MEKPLSDYKVVFEKIAKTLLYDDPQGNISFFYDFIIDPANNQIIEKHSLILECPLEGFKRIKSIGDENLRIAEQKRLELAFDRVTQYLVTCGYKVKVWPDE